MMIATTTTSTTKALRWQHVVGALLLQVLISSFSAVVEGGCEIVLCHPQAGTIEVCEAAIPGLVNGAGATVGPCCHPEGFLSIPAGQCDVQCFDCATCSDGYADGCNVCTCDGNGNLLSCTDADCEEKGEAFCLPGCESEDPCPQIRCAPGYIPVTPGGECCPLCVPEIECDDDGICCDPLTEPGRYGNPFCFEGHQCCPDGTWSCSIGDAITFPCGGVLITEGFGERCPDVIDCKTCPQGYNDGCNDCTCDPTTGLVACTEKACSEYDEPFCLTIDCTTCPLGYNDGCNDCTCNPGGRAQCSTERACLVQGDPYCLPPDCTICRNGYIDECGNTCDCENGSPTRCSSRPCVEGQEVAPECF